MKRRPEVLIETGVRFAQERYRGFARFGAGAVLAAVLTLAGLPGGNIQAEPATRTRVIELTQYGFQPSAITNQPGVVHFLLRSRLAGQPQFEIFETGSGKNRKQVQEPGRIRANQDMTLSPGTYQIDDSRFPQWKCVITVQP